MSGLREDHDLSLLDVVIAIDFGTSRSGYAWASFRRRNILTSDSYPGRRPPYPKTLTEVLYGPDRTLKAWGYPARRELATLRKEERAGDHNYFKNFKMALWDGSVKNPMSLLDDADSGDDDRRPQSDVTLGSSVVVPGPDGPAIKKDDGSTFSVVVVIADYLRELKKFALREINEKRVKERKDSAPREVNAKQIDVAGIAAKDALWVLTVPAIWTDQQKQWMRRAATIAELVGDEQDPRLQLVYEPEAAAIYCFEEAEMPMRTGTRFTVVDAGGGTVDLTSYVVIEGGLEEIGVGTGRPCGGRLVDLRFFDHLDLVLHSGVAETLQRSEPEDYVDLLDNWEGIKCEGLDEEEGMACSPFLGPVIMGVTYSFIQ